MKAKFLAVALGFVLMISTNILAQESETVLFVPSDQLGDYWLNEKKVAPIYPRRAAINSKEGCAAVVYIIEADGSTSNHRVVAAFPKRYFDKSSIQAAKYFLYKPAEKNAKREAVYTTNSFTYELHYGGSKNLNENKRKKLADKCTNAANKVLAEETGKTDEG